MTITNRIGRRQLLAGASAVGASLPTLAALNSSASPQSNKPIIIGAAIPLTGWAAADGLEIRRGLEMAWEEVNQQGGILGRPVKLVIEDTKDMGAENTVSATQRLIERHGVSAIVNGYNTGALCAEYEAVADAHICYLHDNTDISHNQTFAKNPKRYYSVFMCDPPEYWYGEGLLNYLNGLAVGGIWKPLNKKIAIVTGSQNYSVVIANAIKSKAKDYGWEIGLYETVVVPISEWGPSLAKLRADPPGVIAITHFLPQDLAQFMIQFAPNPTKSLVYMQYGPSLSAFRKIGGQATNGVIYSSTMATLPDEIGSDFTKRYRAKYGPDASALTAGMPYDNVHAFSIAAALAGGVGAQGDAEQTHRIADRLRSNIYRGVNGSLRFTAEQAGYTYPTQTKDPSLGFPHQYLQIQDYTKDPSLISPPPYEMAKFALPPWLA
jgi:branched-chain amino acid transport system substrate-binding protein